jgi:DNA-directed RNA polymerase II subunit RPB2
MQERLMEASDAFRVHVCTSSGLITAAKLKSKTYISLVGDDNSEVVQVYMPYACKLLFQELMSMCIVPRLYFEKPAARGVAKPA